MDAFLDRAERLFGKENMEKLIGARVAIFGVGGVGSYVCEALARSGIGQLDLFDPDAVHESNLNRQLEALHSTLGRDKVDVLKERILDINPNAIVTLHKVFFLPENADSIDFSAFDYVVDAIDTVAGKLAIIEACDKVGTPVISSMGTGNKIHPELLELTDIFKTSVCPLAKAMRTQLRKRGIKKLKVVYSKEEPRTTGERTVSEEDGRPIHGSNAFVPGTAGLILAGAVVRDLLGIS